MTIETKNELNSIKERLINEKRKNPKFESFYTEKHEGDVFCHIHATTCFGKVSISKRYYTVKNGLVHEIHNGKLCQTEDSVFTLQYQCVKIGKYNPKFKYQQKCISVQYGQFLKQNKLR